MYLSLSLSFSLSLSLSLSIRIHIYIYICRERERERGRELAQTNLLGSAWQYVVYQQTRPVPIAVPICVSSTALTKHVSTHTADDDHLAGGQ